MLQAIFLTVCIFIQPCGNGIDYSMFAVS